MIELRPVRTLADDELAPLVDASTVEGYRFVARLAAEWVRGVRYDGPGELLLGGYDGTRLVAVGGLTPDPYSADPAVGRLRRIYVLPEVRRRGVGRAVVRALEAEAARWYRELVLRTDTDAAARFYEALGYASRTEGGSATHGRPLHGAAVTDTRTSGEE
jgi:GNAT superfamily N-acetyltransferase